jgi:exodeoxyribonuclease VII small subunit
MAKASFESDMKKLEEIVDRIESGEVGLEDSIKLVEEASRLVGTLKKRLAEAELKVRELVRGPDGELELEDEKEAGSC